jgi:hypothetical protein
MLRHETPMIKINIRYVSLTYKILYNTFIGDALRTYLAKSKEVLSIYTFTYSLKNISFSIWLCLMLTKEYPQFPVFSYIENKPKKQLHWALISGRLIIIISSPSHCIFCL